MEVKKMNRAQRRLFTDICRFCKSNNQTHAIRHKEVSKDTSHTRFKILVRALVFDLHATGHRREKLLKLKPGDIIALIQYWETRIGAQTMRNRLSVLRWLCRKLNKLDIMPKDWRVHMRDPSRYVPSNVSKVQKELQTKTLNVDDFLRAVFEKDVLVGLVQLLKIEWGLRRREAIMTRPHEQDKGDYFEIAKSRGSKGGRPRAISHYNFQCWLDEETGELVVIDPQIDPVKRQILDLLKRFTSKRGSLIPDGYSLSRWMRWERTVVEEYCGLSMSKLGVTSHKFRHEYAQARCAIVGGLTHQFRPQDSQTREEAAVDHVARRVTTEELGHSDRATINCYAGPAAGRAARGFVNKLEAAFQKHLAEPVIRRAADGRIIGGSGLRVRIEYSDTKLSNDDCQD